MINRRNHTAIGPNWCALRSAGAFDRALSFTGSALFAGVDSLAGGK